MQRSLAVLAAAAILALAPRAGHAQLNSIDPANDSTARPGTVGPIGAGGFSSGAGAGQADTPDDAAGAKKSTNTAPPPSLPGSHAQPTAIAPAEHVATDMEPTAALFDAINRGDSAAARDALTRGASLDGRNVLGLTPIELSVDLHRNDISFLLLSMRTANGEATPPNRAAPRLAAAAPAPVIRARAIARIPTPASVTSDSAAANPDAGFLGYGGH